ncbi:ABC transporter permease [Arthrobacter ramosus]|uniref:ABC transporter permease n=2 Tax=Arthrobacter TaxID=1663 RepID=A0ABV5XT61_ARTRM|nr:ABC transporter permease [Arthrobacter ramosus]
MSKTIPQTVRLPRVRSGKSGAMRRLGRNRAAVVSFAVVLIFALLAVLSPVITPYDPNVGNVVDSLASPSAAHWLGTDDLGRDVFSRVIDASKIAMTVSLLSVGIALVIGLVLGVIAGYTGGAVDGLINRSQDVMFAFPELLLAIIIVAVMGPSLLNASFAISLLYIPRFVRLSRSATLQIKTSEFLDAARLAGVRPLRILWTHVVPNVFPSVIVLAALSMSTAQLAYASLAFLGLGVSPPQADWGGMLSTGRNYITVAPWLVLGPSVAVVALVLAFNVLGDAVRDVLDPRSESIRGAGVPTV